MTSLPNQMEKLIGFKGFASDTKISNRNFKGHEYQEKTKRAMMMPHLSLVYIIMKVYSTIEVKKKHFSFRMYNICVL